MRNINPLVHFEISKKSNVLSRPLTQEQVKERNSWHYCKQERDKILGSSNQMQLFGRTSQVIPIYWDCFCMLSAKSMYCSEVHGGAGLGFRSAPAHYIAEQVQGTGFQGGLKNILYHATLTTYPRVCQLLLLSLDLFIKQVS